jgi:hypothetical protein
MFVREEGGRCQVFFCSLVQGAPSGRPFIGTRVSFEASREAEKGRHALGYNPELLPEE